MTEYRPVDCALHSEYELAIMRRRSLHLSWHGRDALMHIEVVQPTDLFTRHGEKFLVVRRAGGRLEEIRLDRILAHRDA